MTTDQVSVKLSDSKHYYEGWRPSDGMRVVSYWPDPDADPVTTPTTISVPFTDEESNSPIKLPVGSMLYLTACRVSDNSMSEFVREAVSGAAGDD
nr:hypothetical protein [Marinicella sp. W31]MDC2879878.1 hypothetical protein [Marinicella sp. W31]